MATSSNIETHPWEPFLPEGAKILMLGSFPPKENRWSMDFFYPNFNNDMWRIMGLVFYGDKDRFIADAGTGSGQVRRFDKEKIIKFCSSHGIALYDTVSKARRLNDNASDKFLETVEPQQAKRPPESSLPGLAAMSRTQDASWILKLTERISDSTACRLHPGHIPCLSTGRRKHIR